MVPVMSAYKTSTKDYKSQEITLYRMYSDDARAISETMTAAQIEKLWSLYEKFDEAQGELARFLYDLGVPRQITRGRWRLNNLDEAALDLSDHLRRSGRAHKLGVK